MSAPRLSRAIVSLAILAALALAAFASVSGDAAGPPRRTVYSKDLPAGEGQDLVASKCLTCHSTMLITQQHKDSTAWEGTVNTMAKWGARLVPDDRATVVRYLHTNFGSAKK